MSPVETDPRLKAESVTIRPLGAFRETVRVLGSKSYSNRYLALASLSGEPTVIEGALVCDDTRYLADALTRFGHVEADVDAAAERITVTPTGRPMRAPEEDVYVGAAGTPIRILIAMAGHAEGTTVLTGTARMQERPMGSLLDALPGLGVTAEAVRGNGSPPVRVTGPSFRGGSTRISGAVSSQFTSSLLINATRAERDTEIHLVDELVSKPYVDMTVAALAEMGVTVERDGYRRFAVAAGQKLRGGTVRVEPDASGMSYFLAAAAVLGGTVTLPGIGAGSHQGDVGLVAALTRMGCTADVTDDSVTLTGGDLRGIDIDMETMPDVVPTLAVVAAFAEGTTHISNIASLRIKECDRIAAVATELRKMGITVEEHADALTITGGTPHGAVIDTYDDHRIAMCFAVAGLRTPGVVIKDPGCVAKSFPTFWQKLDTLAGPTTSTL
ncbi:MULTISPECIES: 3-phosphoshikimate 1-carboxyvinyltransferase [Streptomyces]|uniref:3-phosphoshikimate 1-carboxyvinyltransferase n=1 Tax=Streptomyces TaxID=1883 RepID=UPI00081BB1DA|nr:MULTISPECIES: 3-phosphoshikimate 1-carboxyvinyltransferase [Streptomyces]MBT3078092.1 3-phosphoshikimate 1-carboxyvinyltransferase [Streptomyces sp. COG21]MBT3084936.1 3-phosphoshikimate 1-carboxyvinyltransferase [Streptomyces sp. COG20]MBT3087075.1 3-phosphoshikimate 1-carboxyvinyltransferase [Streptomyces sp. CYG21]MBT3097198.1 3-phosphoshikimate 1-carboxyvinyltransferase [Streptomyces sp. CBG30]MBT3103117.1 3-phosphoshikimate 1-carboxyvinyltransferase [Streptomyces sp. COG19]